MIESVSPLAHPAPPLHPPAEAVTSQIPSGSAEPGGGSTREARAEKRPRRSRPVDKTAQDSAAQSDSPGRREAVVAKPRRSKIDELAEFRAWLTSLDLGVQPTIHVNGAVHAFCVLVVDFGTPLGGIKLSAERSAELYGRMKSATKIVVNRDVKVSVMNDHANGVWWTSAS